jgi:hypothetical protein
LLNHPLFGLQLAQVQEPDVYGCVAALCRAASSVRESVVRLHRLRSRWSIPVSVMELVEGTETAELRWYVRADLGSNNQANYQAAMLNLKLLRLIGRQDVSTELREPGRRCAQRDIFEIENKLGCRFHKTAADNAIAFGDTAGSTRRQLQPAAVHAAGQLLDRVKSASRPRSRNGCRITSAAPCRRATVRSSAAPGSWACRFARCSA